MRGDVFKTVFQMHAFVGRRLFRKADTGPPFPRRTDRPGRKAAAAIRADIAEFGFHAAGAERAFIGADARVHCRWRQVLVAKFAVRSELQGHGGLAEFVGQ